MLFIKNNKTGNPTDLQSKNNEMVRGNELGSRNSKIKINSEWQNSVLN